MKDESQWIAAAAITSNSQKVLLARSMTSQWIAAAAITSNGLLVVFGSPLSGIFRGHRRFGKGAAQDMAEQGTKHPPPSPFRAGY